MSASYATTRRSLHGAAELILAGPRYAAGGSMRLRVDGEGIRTWDDPPLRLAGGELVAEAAGTALDGMTFARAAASVGLTAQSLDHVYHDGSHVAPDEVIVLDPDEVGRLERALALGDAALRAFAPEAERVLWPEHFDVAITVGEVNYGVSPGDGYHDLPYAYVGPHEPRQGEFWNAPFGAARPVTDFADSAALTAFFQAGSDASALGGSPSGPPG